MLQRFSCALTKRRERPNDGKWKARRDARVSEVYFMFTKAIVVQSYERLPTSHVEEAACAQVPRACATRNMRAVLRVEPDSQNTVPQSATLIYK